MSTSLAAALADAHRKGQLLAHDSLPVPANTSEAMAAQAAMAQALGAKVAGWKVAIRPDGEAVAAPIYASCLHQGAGPWRVGLFKGCGGEVEIGLRLARDIPKRAAPYTREELLDAVSELFVGLEWVESRFRDRESAPFPQQLADNMNHGAYLCGPAVANWRGLDRASLRCLARIDGATVHDKAGGHPNGDPLETFFAYANAQTDALGGLKAGQIVTTGSLTPLLVMNGAGRLEGEVEGLGAISVAVEPAPRG